MALYKPTYRDPKTNEMKESRVWWYEFTFAGRRIRESAKTTRKTIAEQAERNKRLELEKAYAGIPSEKADARIDRVSDRIKAYLTHYPSNHRANSVIYVKQRLAHVDRLLGKVLLIDLTEDAIRNYIETRLQEKTGGRTINMEVGELSRAVSRKWSVAWPNVRKLEENHDVGRALSPEEERALLTAAAHDDSPNRNPMLYAFLKIALATGMRSGEIASLRWRQIDFSAGVLTVGRAKTKGGSGRQIPMNADLRMALQAHAVWYADPKRFREIRPEWCVFPARSGRPVSGKLRPYDPNKPIASLNSSWEALRTKAGVSCRLHDLRHTAATKMAEAGVPESTMMALMGHMSRAMLEKYSHVRMAAKRVAVESLSLPSIGAKPVSVSSGIPKVDPTVSAGGLIQ